MAKAQTNSLLQYAGIAFIGYLLLGKLFNSVSNNIAFGRPRIQLGKVNFQNKLPKSVSAVITLPVTNNNSVSFPIDDLVTQILYGTYLLSSLRLSKPVEIASGATTDLVFNTTLDFSQLAGNVIALVASGEFLQALRLEGTAYSAGVAIPFEKTISVG